MHGSPSLTTCLLACLASDLVVSTAPSSSSSSSSCPAVRTLPTRSAAAAATTAVCHPEMGPGKARHIAGLAGTPEGDLWPSVHHGGGTNQEDKDCHHLPIVAAGLGAPLCVLARQQHGHLVELPVGHQQRNFRALAGKRRQLGDGWEAPPMGRRQLLQDLRQELDLILHLSSHRGSHTRMHCGTRVGHHAGGTVADCHALDHSLALYQPCLQQVLSLTRVKGCGEHRGCRLKVLRLIPTRALALPRQLTDTGSVRWRHRTLKLMGGPTWVPGSESLHLPGCPVWIPIIYLMAIYSPLEET